MPGAASCPSGPKSGRGYSRRAAAQRAGRRYPFGRLQANTEGSLRRRGAIEPIPPAAASQDRAAATAAAAPPKAAGGAEAAEPEAEADPTRLGPLAQTKQPTACLRRARSKSGQRGRAVAFFVAKSASPTAVAAKAFRRFSPRVYAYLLSLPYHSLFARRAGPAALPGLIKQQLHCCRAWDAVCNVQCSGECQSSWHCLTGRTSGR